MSNYWFFVITSQSFKTAKNIPRPSINHLLTGGGFCVKVADI
jgi:hypothetical protein